MKFSVFSLSALVAAVLAQESGDYGFIAIKSGDSNVHQQGFKITSNGTISLGGETELTVTYDQKTGRFTVAGSNPTETLTVEAPDYAVVAKSDDGSGGFAIDSQQAVSFNGEQNFYVVPGSGDDNYALHAGGSSPSGAVGIILQAVSRSGSSSSAAPASSGAPATSSAPAPATSEAPAPASSSGAPVVVNGAAANAASFGVAALGAAALLI